MTKVTFPGSEGQALAAALTLPSSRPRAFALFAHCFTCGKDSLAAARIARALTARGFGVLRFDFTGLGGSEGDFANTDFTSNVEDLVAAARFLADEHGPPELLLGHSLGGTAALAAAPRIEACRAVATIAAPASPDHVIAHFDSRLEEIEREGQAEVEIGGRSFPIRRAFIEDLRGQELPGRLRRLRRPLLVLHSPHDRVVSVEQAARIFESALHPKSFVSLDRADHLLTDRADADYAAEVIAGWASRYVGEARGSERPDVPAGAVRVMEEDQRFLRHVLSDDHELLCDEPQRVGGTNRGPDPYELLLAALGSCTSMTIRMYAAHKAWPLEDVDVTLSHEREHAGDCEDCESTEGRVAVIERVIALEGELTQAQRKRLLEIADRCPVHKTLTNEIRIRTHLSE